MRIGILGCGYVGQALAKSLHFQGHQISVTTRSSQRIELLEPLANEIHLILQPDDLLAFLTPLEVLIICVAPDSSSGYRSTYLDLAENIVQRLPQTKNLRQLIYTSSTSVYGDHEGEWVDEETDAQPLNENGRILLETEKCYLTASESVNTCIFRLGEIFGPGRLIEERLKRTYQNKFPGNGTPYTNLIHLDDIIRAIDLAIHLHLQGIFNLCNDLHIPRKEFYAGICHKWRIPAIQWDERLISSHGGNKRVNNQKFKALNFHFTPYLIT